MDAELTWTEKKRQTKFLRLSHCESHMSKRALPSEQSSVGGKHLDSRSSAAKPQKKIAANSGAGVGCANSKALGDGQLCAKLLQ